MVVALVADIGAVGGDGGKRLNVVVIARVEKRTESNHRHSHSNKNVNHHHHSHSKTVLIRILG